MSGGISVNETLLHVAQHDLPFGGVGGSGMGFIIRERVLIRSLNYAQFFIRGQFLLSRCCFSRHIQNARGVF